MNGVVLAEVALIMTESDNVATVLDDLKAGQTIEYEGATITLDEDVPFGHKITLTDIAEGETVQKYGEVIGQATQDITPGEWVHTHNVDSMRGRGDLMAKEDAT